MIYFNLQNLIALLSLRRQGNKWLSAMMSFFMMVSFAMVANGQQWANVGSPGFSTSSATAQNLVFHPNGTPYVAYVEANKVVVKSFNGTIWNDVGSTSLVSYSVYNISFAMDANGVPYLAYFDGGSTYGLNVKRYDSVTGVWTDVGNLSIFSDAVFATQLKLAIDLLGIPHIAYESSAGTGYGTVKKFDGTNWVDVGVSGARISVIPIGYLNLVFQPVTNKPYVAYQDKTVNNRVVVCDFDGIQWTIVGVNSLSYHAGQYQSLAFHPNGNPYVAYGINSSSFLIYFDGTNWINVGAATGFSAGAASYHSLAFHPITQEPYIAYCDQSNGNKTIVKRFSNSNWIDVGLATGVSVGGANYQNLAFNPITAEPYVAYQDVANGNKATVMSYSLRKYRTNGNVTFASSTNWESSFDGTTWAAAIMPPDATGVTSTINIRNGHTAVVGTNITLDEITVESGGTLQINQSVTLTLQNGAGTDLQVNGKIDVQGSGKVAGAGSFVLSGSASFFTSNPLGVSGAITTTKSFIAGASYTFNGTTQSTGLTGITSWGNPANITIAGTQVTLDRNTTISNKLTINAGKTFVIGAGVTSLQAYNGIANHGTVNNCVGATITPAYTASSWSPKGIYNAPAAQPTSEATNITFSDVTAHSATISWTAGNGAKRVVVVRYPTAVSSTALLDNNTYTANPVVGTLPKADYYVYNGTDNRVNITGLNPGVVYNVSVFEYNENVTCASYNYKTGNPLSGSFTAANIIVKGNNNPIYDGDTSPSSTDYTDFGTSYNISSASVTRQFVVKNLGADPLTISSIALSNPTNFTVLSTTPTFPASGGVTRFYNDELILNIKFSGNTIGVKNCVVTVNNNDPQNGGVYTFAIRGEIVSGDTDPGPGGSGRPNPTVTDVKPPKPEINVQGNNGVNIVDGDITPTWSDGTLFGDIAPTISVTRTFTIQNVSAITNPPAANLAISSITSSHPAFKVANLSSNNIPLGGSATFTVTFNPPPFSIANPLQGNYTATITINNNDGDESAYDFVVTGAVNSTDIERSVLKPEINVQGGSGNVNIVDGDITPTLSDGTLFGDIAPTVSLTRTFTIQNISTANQFATNLIISSITSSHAAFKVDNLSSTNIPVGGSATFTVTFNPPPFSIANPLQGNYTATITINNNDLDEGVYDFVVAGSVDSGDVERGIGNNNTSPEALTIKTFPNPSKGNFTIVVGKQEAALPARLLNSQGVEVWKGAVKEAETQVRTTLPAGLYFLHIEKNGERKVQKIVIE